MPLALIILGISSAHAQEPLFASLVDPTLIKFSQEHADNVNEHALALSTCLIEAWSNESQRRLKEGKLPSMKASIYEQMCMAKENEAYTAIYSAAFAGKENVQEDSRHRTALKGIRTIKKSTFDEIAKNYNPD